MPLLIQGICTGRQGRVSWTGQLQAQQEGHRTEDGLEETGGGLGCREVVTLKW